MSAHIQALLQKRFDDSMCVGLSTRRFKDSEWGSDRGQTQAARLHQKVWAVPQRRKKVYKSLQGSWNEVEAL